MTPENWVWFVFVRLGDLTLCSFVIISYIVSDHVSIVYVTLLTAFFSLWSLFARKVKVKGRRTIA